MKTQVKQSAQAGNIIRRVREDKGLSRAQLARAAHVSSRTLFAFEQGENENIGLAGFLRLASALDLIIWVDDGVSLADGKAKPATATITSIPRPKWDRLGDVWQFKEDQ